MIEGRSILRLGGAAAIASAAVLALLVLLVHLINSGYDEVLFHLFGGFYFFLRENLARLSADSATWIPGLFAFCLALVIAHRFLLPHAVRQNRGWSFATTACLGMVLPILFVVAFIVPGVLLQVNSLASAPWFERSSSLPAMVSLSLRNIAQACHFTASISPDGRFPESLGSLDPALLPKNSLLIPSTGANIPLEPPIYLGAGFTLDSPPHQALLISPTIRTNPSEIRILVTRSGDTLEIPAEDVDSWIDRVLNEAKSAALR